MTGTSRTKATSLYLLAMLAGLCQAWSMGLPFHLGANGALQWVGLLVLALLVLVSKTSKECARLAFAFQSTALGATFWWIFISLYVYGQMNWFLAVFAVIVLASALALYWLLFAVLFFKLYLDPKPSGQSPSSWLHKFGQKAQMAFGFGAAWLLSELCRGQWLTGFPWGSSGYAHNDTWLSIFAPWLGVYGIGAISAGLAMWVAKTCLELHHGIDREGAAIGARKLGARTQRRLGSFHSNQWRMCAWVVLPFLSLVSWPYLIDQDQNTPTKINSDGYSKPLSIELLQGNVPQQTKFQDDRVSSAQWYYDRIMASDAQLVVTPETAFAMTLKELPPTFVESIKSHLLAEKQAVLFGIPSKDEMGYANSALGIVGLRDQVYRYDKVHLVPFGEFIPPMFQWFTNQMQMPLGFFMGGFISQSSLVFLDQRIAPNICYEDLFGEELAAQFQDAQHMPSILVNMSNIAWFGDSVILDQHLEISRMRALELRRPMIRATNTGVSAIIDHTGRVDVKAKFFSKEAIKGVVQGRFDRPTFFAWWASRYGLLPLWVLALLVLGTSWCQKILASKRQKQVQEKLEN